MFNFIVLRCKHCSGYYDVIMNVHLMMLIKVLQLLIKENYFGVQINTLFIYMDKSQCKITYRLRSEYLMYQYLMMKVLQ